MGLEELAKQRNEAQEDATEFASALYNGGLK